MKLQKLNSKHFKESNLPSKPRKIRYHPANRNLPPIHASNLNQQQSRQSRNRRLCPRPVNNPQRLQYRF